MRQVFPYPKYTLSVYTRSIRSANIYTRMAVGDFSELPQACSMKNLSTIRRSKHLSQTALAEMVGVKQATISRIEKGVNNPSLAVAHAIAKALNVNVVELFGLPELEQRVLQSFREASPERQAALLTLLGTDQ